MLMIVLDQTIVNVALPSIRRDLGFSQAGLAWVVNAYLIAYGGLLLLGGRLGDLIGRRDVLRRGQPTADRLGDHRHRNAGSHEIGRASCRERVEVSDVGA